MEESIKDISDQISNEEKNIGIMSPSALRTPIKGHQEQKKVTSIMKNGVRLSPNKVVSFIEMDSVKIYDSPFPITFKVNTKNLIEKYILECDKNKVKPLSKVVKQLEEFPEITERIAKLDLKGVKLDCKAVEALEIIFMNVQVHHLDVESTLLDEDSCAVLCEIVEYYNSATHLSLSSNTRIGFSGWKALCNLISKSSILDQIDLNRMVITDTIISNFCRAINVSSSLRILYLENCYLNNERLKLLANVFSRSFTIEQLYLGENKISSVDCECIGEMLKRNRCLRLLDMRNNPIQDLGLKMLFDGLYDSETSQLEYIELWNTNITSVGMQYIATYLGKIQNGQLTTSLKSLNIGKNKIGYEGILTLKSPLIRNTSLRRLGLANAKMNDSSMITLGEVLAENRSIRKIDLRENDIRENGIIGLSKTVIFNKSVIIIKFSTDFKRDPTMAADYEAALKVIDQIVTTNKQNESIGGRPSSDLISLISGISTEYMHRNTSNTETSLLKSAFNNIFSYPLELAKRTFWRSSKTESIEAIHISQSSPPTQTKPLNIAPNSPIPSTEVEAQGPMSTQEKQEPPVITTKSTSDLNHTLPTPIQHISRFEVRRSEFRRIEHRSSKSESIRYERSSPHNIVPEARGNNPKSRREVLSNGDTFSIQSNPISISPINSLTASPSVLASSENVKSEPIKFEN